MKKSVLRKRMMVLVSVAALGAILTSCGTKSANENPSQGVIQEESDGYVYVSEAMELELPEGTYLGESLIIGNHLYYDSYDYDEATGIGTNCVVRHDLENDTVEKIPMKLDVGEELEAYMGRYTVGQDGCIYAVWNVNPVWKEGKEFDYNDRKYYLSKMDAQGALIYKQDITETMMEDEMNSYIQNLAVGKDGVIFAASENIVRIFGEDGSFQGKVQTGGGWIMGLVSGIDGRVFVSQYSQQGSGVELVEILPDANSMGETYKNLPNGGNAAIIPGIKEDFLVCGSNDLYAYNLADQTSTEILSWTGCNVMGSSVRSIAAMEDGTYLAICADYSTDTTEIVRLTQKLRSEVPQKTTIVLGTFNSSQDLQRAVVSFNKKSAEYMIEIDPYEIDYQENWTVDDYNNAITQFNASLVGENAPDIIDISYNIDVGSLVSKGAFEDILPYLENSTVIGIEDFVEGIIKAHTISGKLITLPRYVTLETLMARTDLVGEDSGWALQDVMDFAKKYPEADLMMYATKTDMLNTILQYSFEAFVDLEKATCSFDSQEFMDILAFANSFPAEYDYSQQGPSLPTRIQSGTVLLSNASIHNTQAYQMYDQMFGEVEVTNIGYPTFDGSLGTFMQGSEMYAILANSKNKEGAWRFIEEVLSYERLRERETRGFPSRKDELEEIFTLDMTPEYQLDEKGQTVLDANGNPVENAKTHWGYDDWDTEIYAATQEDVDQIKEMMDKAKSVLTVDDALFDMVQEEAQSYFSGQKSVEDVVKIIQSMAGIYVSENY